VYAQGDTEPAPWSKRKRPKEAGLGNTGWGVIDVKVWPTEPASPPAASLEPARLATALQALCPKLSAARAGEYAGWIITYSREFTVDAMLLAALVYQEGRCKRRKDDYGVGLTKLNLGMHRRHWDKDTQTYTYWLPDNSGSWVKHALKLPKFPFSLWQVKKPEQGLYFSAALISVFDKQCPHIDNAHGASVPHRSPVSHFVWGDKVLSSHEESEVLIARRRVIRHYTGKPSPLRGAYKDRPLMSPLEGPPRKLTGGWGDPRGKRRTHKGVDYSSIMAEPVRAIADGTVWMAGADLERRPTASYHPDKAPLIPKKELGRAGLLVLLDHGGGLTSGYMHLLKYTVKTHQKVKAGQVIGYVGRSGVKESSAHLHFEIRVDGKRVDPVPLLGPLVIDHMKTRAGVWRQKRWDKDNAVIERKRKEAANERWKERLRKKKAAREARKKAAN